MTTISIPGKEAKKHIAAALKSVFPSIKFNFKSSFDTVSVFWTDGPIANDVEKVLNRFESYTRVLCQTDYHKATGYEWEGEIYIGPRYLNASRTLSENRKNQIKMHMELEDGPSYYDATKSQQVQAELDLIELGVLEGFAPEDMPHLLLDERPVINNRKPVSQVNNIEIPQNVIPFPSMAKNPSNLGVEQQLKLAYLKEILPADLTEPLQTNLMVDLTFAAIAEQLFGEGR